MNVGHGVEATTPQSTRRAKKRETLFPPDACKRPNACAGTAHPNLDDQNKVFRLCHEIEFEGSNADVTPQDAEALLDEVSGSEILGASAYRGSTFGHGTAGIDRGRARVA